MKNRNENIKSLEEKSTLSKLEVFLIDNLGFFHATFPTASLKILSKLKTKYKNNHAALSQLNLKSRNDKVRGSSLNLEPDDDIV